MLPRDFAPWLTVYYYFASGSSRMCSRMRWRPSTPPSRKAAGCEESPSLGIIDSQSVKTSHHADPSCKEIDGNKKVKGRKEHVVVDTLGLPLAVSVHQASLHDNKWVAAVIERLDRKFAGSRG